VSAISFLLRIRTPFAPRLALRDYNTTLRLVFVATRIRKACVHVFSGRIEACLGRGDGRGSSGPRPRGADQMPAPATHSSFDVLRGRKLQSGDTSPTHDIYSSGERADMAP